MGMPFNKKKLDALSAVAPKKKFGKPAKSDKLPVDKLSGFAKAFGKK